MSTNSKSKTKRMSRIVGKIKITYSIDRFDSRWEKETKQELLKILGRSNEKSIWTQIVIEGVSGRFDVGFQFGSENPTLVIVEYDGEQHFKGYGVEQIQSKDIEKQKAAIDAGAFFVRIDHNQKTRGINSTLQNAMLNLRKIRKSKDFDKSKMVYYSNPALYRWIEDNQETGKWCCVQ